MKNLSLFLLIGFSLLSALQINADQILVLSGGGTPLSNHYSQYLQTKTLYTDLVERFPKSEPKIFFGAGNREGSAPVVADVHRSVKSESLSIETLVPGFIANNTAATPQNVEGYFQQPKLANMAKNENMFLLVSDHGMPYVKPDGSSDGTFENNCIDLWGFISDLETGAVSELNSHRRCLSKNILQGYLEKKISAGRVIFAMSQCYSGGFHKMSVSTTAKYPKANPRICGFTAVTEDTTSSGCTADVDGPNYKGYERSFTEQLTGIDIVSGERLRPARASLQEAHFEATVDDLTKDIPISTSDYYLWKWALSIEQKGFAPRTKTATSAQAIAALSSAMVGQGSVRDPAYLAKEQLFQKMQKTITNLYPELEGIGSQILSQHKSLEELVSLQMQEIDSQANLINESLQQKRALLLRQWTEAVRTGKSGLSEIERSLELGVFAQADDENAALIFMAVNAITEPTVAAALSSYKSKREEAAMNWAIKSKRRDLRVLAHNIRGLKEKMATFESVFDKLQKKHGLIRRLLIYRQILGAWAALEKMQDRQALNELKGLLECESTKL